MQGNEYILVSFRIVLNSQNNQLSFYFRRILKSEPPYPQEMTALAKDLIQCLLMKDPKKRLGCGSGSADEIKQHSFFKVKSILSLL